MESNTKSNIKPFLRWAGGKQWLAQRLVKLTPEYDNTYFEPFLGGGSLFFAARPKKAILSDINEKLIDTYRVVRDRPKDLISILSQWQNNEETYYKLRNSEYKDKVWQAAQFIYLNKTCWNGLYRVNQQGRFNVPFGHNKRKVYEEMDLLKVSALLQNADIVCADFQTVLNKAKACDFVYLDPPYTVLHSHNGFRQYNEKLFSWQDQVRLAHTARELYLRGCLVVVSNADSEEVQELYQGFLYHRVTRHSVLAANPKWRRRTDECLLVSSESLML